MCEMMSRQRSFKVLLISFSLCLQIAISQHVCDETANPCSGEQKETGSSYKTRPEPPHASFKRRPGGGLTWEPCEQNSDCLSPRTCRKVFKNGNSRPCSSQRNCLCDVTVDLASTCIHDSECHRGEFCFLVFKNAVGNCFSKRVEQYRYLRPRGKRQRRKKRPSNIAGLEDNAGDNEGKIEYTATPAASPHGLGIKSDGDNVTSQENKPEGGRFCIGVNCLSHLSRKELKFEEDIEAKVLCDEFNSCATSGHVVIVNGRGMMMSSYCKLTKCYERVMMVNSPKESKYVRMKSKTSGVLFTGYSARYGTKVEETMFRMLTSVGL